MNKVFKVGNREYIEGKDYYIVDWYYTSTPKGNVDTPIISVGKCEAQNIEDEGVEFYIKTYKNIITTEYPLGGLEHPSGYGAEWEDVCFDTLEEAIERLYEEYKYNQKHFFDKIFIPRKR